MSPLGTTTTEPRVRVLGVVMPTPPALVSLQRTMAAAGWEVAFVDLELTGTAPKAEIKVTREDGRWLWARVDTLGRCTVETFHRENSLGMATNQKGRRPLVPLVDDYFLGRTRHEGPRAMLRHITTYLSDNSIHPVALSVMRAAWEKIMSAPTRMLAGA